MEHFEELLNRVAPQGLLHISPFSNDLPVNCDSSPKEDICQAIRGMKNSKSAGPNSIPAAAWKNDIEISVELLYLLSKILEEEQVHSEKNSSSVIWTSHLGVREANAVVKE